MTQKTLSNRAPQNAKKLLTCMAELRVREILTGKKKDKAKVQRSN